MSMVTNEQTAAAIAPDVAVITSKLAKIHAFAYTDGSDMLSAAANIIRAIVPCRCALINQTDLAVHMFCFAAVMGALMPMGHVRRAIQAGIFSFVLLTESPGMFVMMGIVCFMPRKMWLLVTWAWIMVVMTTLYCSAF